MSSFMAMGVQYCSSEERGPYLVILPTQQFWENTAFTLFRLESSKMFPHTPPPRFLTAVIGIIRLTVLEYGLKFGENCLPPKKTMIKNSDGKNTF
jgi:hypothetical protein